MGFLKDERKKIFGRRGRGLGKTIMRLAILAILSAVLTNGCIFINKSLGLPNDNLLETYAEEIIESQTGLVIDLTPNHPNEEECRDQECCRIDDRRKD